MRRVYSTDEDLTDRERKNLLILEAIRRQRETTKTEISKLTKLNIVTISNYVNHFIEEGLVIEKGFDISGGGRRPLLLELNPKVGYVIGLGLSMSNMVGTLTDLAGGVITDLKREKPPVVATRNSPLSQESAEAIIHGLIQLASDLIAESKIDITKIKGIGVGIPGIIDEPGRTVRWTSQIGAPGKESPYDVSIAISVKDLFENRFNIPTFIENDATVAAFGVLWLGLEPGIKNLIYMYSGVGCGIIINGEVYRGTSGGAGEVTIYDPFEEKGNHPLGPLKMVGLDMGMIEKARDAIAKGINSSLKHVPELSAKKIIEAAKEGDTLATELVEDAGVALGIKIAFLVNFVNPEVVVIGGGMEEAGSIILEPIKRIVKKSSFSEHAADVRIIPSQLGENAVALGAASLVIQSAFAQA
ncbi:MAG: ROK family protein [Candidatus Omnitrophica bacterium]|nr:ROK family protein [Candidatus Omnitrophota bacterium]